MPAVARVWPKAAASLGEAELERLEARVLVALRALDRARDTAKAGLTPEANEEIDAAAREVAAAFEAHEPLGVLLTAEFKSLAEGRERFGPAPAPPHWVSWQRSLLVPVLYATDRAPEATAPDEIRFGANSGPLAYGELRVAIPDDHRMGAAKKPRPWRLRFRSGPAEVATLGSLVTSTPQDFAQLAGKRLAECEPRHGLLFVHGYNVTFSAASIRAAQIAYDLNFTGVPLMYSWPSKGSVGGYAADENSVSRSMPHFQRFLRLVLTATGIDELHIIAHSMGSRVLTEALADLDTTSLPRGSGRLGQVIFAAPDVDAEVFRHRLPRIVRQAEGCTLYASSADRALAVSRARAAAPRAGQAGPGIVVAAGLDTIDATALDTGLMGHSYVGDHRSVLADVYGLLRQARPPSERFGLVSVPHAEGSYWSFQPQR
ncbi:alpha/beta hydrolase [Streptomyces swartbergensis]|uniref:alpha/beta hydrolase n=1 Tax=Streptomyces swartbergensis TaxID=487165 RepID=UPI0037FD3CC7